MAGRLERVWPIAAARAANRIIDRRAAEYVAAREPPADDSPEDQDRMEEERWCDRLERSGAEPAVIESVANNVYSAEDRRIQHIENKGSQLFVGAGIMASLMVGVLGLAADDMFAWPRNPEAPLLAWTAFKLLMTAWAVADLFMTTLAVHKATKLAPKHITTIVDLAESLPQDRAVLRWAARHFVAIQNNLLNSLKKANWVAAAQSHFLRGIFVMILAVCLVLFTP